MTIGGEVYEYRCFALHDPWKALHDRWGHDPWKALHDPWKALHDPWKAALHDHIIFQVLYPKAPILITFNKHSNAWE